MKIERIDLYHIALPLVQAFETSFGREIVRHCILVELHSKGISGWGECTAAARPWYSCETVGTAWHVLQDVLVPLVIGQNVAAPTDMARLFGSVRGHYMARAALENALWDVLAQAEGVSLAKMLDGSRSAIPVGVSVGIEPDIDTLLGHVAEYRTLGYGRVKLKIKPGWDVAIVRAVRERWPDLLLQVDANCAYTLEDVDVFKALDELELLLIEQPLHYDDIVDHAHLQQHIHTPICLDESIKSPQHARWALQVGACQIINIKVGRVGGLVAAQEIHAMCYAQNIPVWCGGMLETNVGRAANLALASLPGFTLPADISASARYYAEDVAKPDFVLNADSTITVPHSLGLGVTVDPERLGYYCKQQLVFT